jgi:hypothetical protein
MANEPKPSPLEKGAGTTGQFGARTAPLTEGAGGASTPQARVLLPTGPTAPATVSPAPSAATPPPPQQ